MLPHQVFTFSFWSICCDRIENIDKHKEQCYKKRHPAWKEMKNVKDNKEWVNSLIEKYITRFHS